MSINGTYAVRLSPEEFSAWSQNGRRAARFRVSIKRAARSEAQDGGFASCVVAAPNGSTLEDVPLYIS
jgi:hypothetical protein